MNQYSNKSFYYFQTVINFNIKKFHNNYKYSY